MSSVDNANWTITWFHSHFFDKELLFVWIRPMNTEFEEEWIKNHLSPEKKHFHYTSNFSESSEKIGLTLSTLFSKLFSLPLSFSTTFPELSIFPLHLHWICQLYFNSSEKSYSPRTINWNKMLGNWYFKEVCRMKAWAIEYGFDYLFLPTYFILLLLQSVSLLNKKK